jgi:hypothetical protein
VVAVVVESLGPSPSVRGILVSVTEADSRSKASLFTSAIEKMVLVGSQKSGAKSTD